MKVNEIARNNVLVNEGPMDFFRNARAAASVGRQQFAQNQAVDRRNKNYQARLAANIKSLSKTWQNYERTLPNRAALNNNPEAYYQELAKHAAKEFGRSVPEKLNIPDTITPQDTQEFIRQVTSKFVRPTPLPTTTAATGATPATAGPTPTTTGTAATEPASQYSTSAGGFKPSSVNVQYGKPAAGTTTATTAKPMSYSGTAKATLGGTQTATTATPATTTATTPKTKPRVSVRAATGPLQPGATQTGANKAGSPSTPAAPTTAPATTVVKASDIIPNLKGLTKNELNKLYVQLANMVNAPVGSPKK